MKCVNICTILKGDFMANYQELNIQNLAIKMLDGDAEAKNKIIEYYTNYINIIVESNFSNFECNKDNIKNELIKIMYQSISCYKKYKKEYFSHYITRKFIQYYSCELRKLKNKKEYKNREIQQLAIKVINGDNDALNKIIEFYTFHITNLVKEKYNNTNYDEEDLIQIGIVGLLKAIDLYKLKQDYPFSTYANTYIKTEIERELKSLNKTINTEYIGLNNNYNGKAFNNFIENEELKEAIKKLSDVKKKILFLHIYGKYTFDDIGDMFGFSHQRAQGHYKRSIELIKQELDLPNEKQKRL